MLTFNEVFGVFNVVCAILCTIGMICCLTSLYKQRFHSLLIKRRIWLSIVGCVLMICGEGFVIIPGTIYNVEFSFLSRHVSFYTELVYFFGGPFVTNGIFCVLILRYALLVTISTVYTYSCKFKFVYINRNYIISIAIFLL